MMETKDCKIVLLVVYCLIAVLPVRAQEIVVPAGVVPSTFKDARKSAVIETLPDTLELPFFDDFARPGPRPHAPFWTDQFAFVNSALRNFAYPGEILQSANLQGDSKIIRKLHLFRLIAQHLTPVIGHANESPRVALVYQPL